MHGCELHFSYFPDLKRLAIATFHTSQTSSGSRSLPEGENVLSMDVKMRRVVRIYSRHEVVLGWLTMMGITLLPTAATSLMIMAQNSG